MTVRVSAQQALAMLPAALAPYVRQVLGADPLYTQVVESPDHALFTAVIRPKQALTLSTEMTIDLKPDADGTLVTVSTKSQPYIFGYMLVTFDRYINSLFAKLDAAIRHDLSQPISIGEVKIIQRIEMEGLFGTTAVLTSLLLILTLLTINSTGSPLLLLAYSIFGLIYYRIFLNTANASRQ